MDIPVRSANEGRPFRWLAVPLLLGSPCLAVASAVSAIVAADYFRVPPEFTPLVVSALVAGGVLAVAGSAAGGLLLGTSRGWKVIAGMVAALLSLGVYCVLSFSVSYVVLTMIAEAETGRFITR